MKNRPTGLWGVMPCSLVDRYHHFSICVGRKEKIVTWSSLLERFKSADVMQSSLHVVN
jgi:hypothetical protein